MAVGATAVHRQLLLLQQKLLWRIVGAALEQEARLGAGVSNFTYGLAEQTLQAIASGSSSLQLSSLRALVLEHVTLCRSVSRCPAGELLAADASLHCAVTTRRISMMPCIFYMQATLFLCNALQAAHVEHYGAASPACDPAAQPFTPDRAGGLDRPYILPRQPLLKPR